MPFYVYAVPSDGRVTVQTKDAPLEYTNDAEPAPVLIAVVGSEAMADLVTLEIELSHPHVTSSRPLL